MNCFVLRVDGVLCGPIPGVCPRLCCLLISHGACGLVGVAPGLGSHLRVARRGPRRHRRRPALRMRTSRGAEPFINPNARLSFSDAHQIASVINTLVQLSPAF